MRFSFLWRDSRLRLIWLGQTTSIFGDRVTEIALPLLILEQTHSAFDTSLVTSALYIPPILFGLVAGVVADRVNRRTLMILCDLVRAVVLGVVVLFGFAHQAPPLWLLALVQFVIGTGRLFFLTAHGAWLPDISGEEKLNYANAALEASDALSTLTGPPLGTALKQVVGAVLALGVDMLSYLISAWTLLCIRETRIASTPAMDVGSHPRMLMREALEGVRLILLTPAQRLLLGVNTALNIEAAIIILLLTSLARFTLHLSDVQVGLLVGAAGLGGLLGSVIAPALYERGWRNSIAVCLLIAALACLLLAWTGTLTVSWGFYAAFGANLLLDGAISMCFICSGTAGMLYTTREVRGRVRATSNLYGATIRGIFVLVAGLLIDKLGTPLVLLLLACCLLLTSLFARLLRI